MAFHLVTGGGGFIGSNIVKELLKRGEKVRVLDNFSTGRRENLLPILSDIELIEGDIRSYHTVLDALDGVEYIYHQAALPSVPRSISDPITSNDVNISGTLNLLDVARRSKTIKRIVFASSSSVYGDAPEPKKVETLIPRPLSPYAVNKLCDEYYCQVFYKLYGLETVVIRYFNVFGGNQDPNSPYSAVIPKFIRLMKRGESPTIYGDGSTSRDFTYVQNVVWANLAAATAPNVAGEVVNIACGESYSLNELVEGINEALNTKIQPIYTDFRKGDIKFSLADISKAKSLLNYRVLIPFREGLKLTVEEMLQRKDV